MSQANAFLSMFPAGVVGVLLLANVVTTSAADLTGRVVHVVDGAGLIVLVGEKRVNVRLEHIDAPEHGQAYGHQSRQSLIALCGGELASVESSGQDRSGRTLARVHCNGVDAGAEQVRLGMAMVFDRFAPSALPLVGIQAEAKAARRGLWIKKDPVPPWEWREQRRVTSKP